MASNSAKAGGEMNALTPGEVELLAQVMKSISATLEVDLGKMAELRGVARKTITNQWGALKKKLEGDKPQLTDTETAFLSDIGLCLNSPPQIDAKKLAGLLNKAPKTVTNQWWAIKKKLFPTEFPAISNPGNEAKAPTKMKNKPSTAGRKRTVTVTEETSGNDDAELDIGRKTKRVNVGRKQPAVPVNGGPSGSANQTETPIVDGLAASGGELTKGDGQTIAAAKNAEKTKLN